MKNIKWVQCGFCHAEVPVSLDDDVDEWEEPCEICGHIEWEEDKMIVEKFREKLDLHQQELSSYKKTLGSIITFCRDSKKDAIEVYNLANEAIQKWKEK